MKTTIIIVFTDLIDINIIVNIIQYKPYIYKVQTTSILVWYIILILT